MDADTDIDTTTALDVARDAVVVLPNATEDMHARHNSQPPAQPERCDNCALWVQRYAAVGECMLPWSIYSGVRLEGDGCNELPTLLTPGHHNCAGWEEKLPKAFEETKP